VRAPRQPPVARPAALGRRQHLAHLVHQPVEVERLGQPGIAPPVRAEIPVEGDRGKAGDEHDLEVGRDPRRAFGELDAVDARHHHVRQQQVEIAPLQLAGRALAILGRAHVMARAPQAMRQERPHLRIVFRQ
jgi:hypothetical protein